MNYPVWYLPNIGGGTLIAIIAIFHVVIAHLAVGGGLFLVLTEMKALKSGDSGIMAYVKSHTAFFMILTMIFGGLSGVGIWFIISLVSPDATSSLIHNFVFGWAIEWVFFVCEIAALLIYHYRFDKMDRRSHVIIGWLYFIFAWLSLFIINGILGFMLTPGRWMETGNFWHGFFNPGFMPGLIFRTCVSAIFAGIFGLITASFRKNDRLRSDLMKYCAKWIYAPVLLLVLSGIYYTSVMSDEAYRNLFHANPEARIYVRLLILSSAALFTLGLFTIIRIRAWQQKTVAFAMALLCFSWMAGFEYMREIARKPYILYGQMYSNAISPSRMKEIGEKGFLHAAKWSRIKTVTPSNMLEAGEEIFRLQCMACHTVNGYNGIRKRSEGLTERGIEADLTGMGKVNTYMPPFAGNDAEKRALAAWIYRRVQGKADVPKTFTPARLKPERAKFDARNDKYVLLVWNDLGMHCISDNEKYFSFLPPANTLNAQLFRRGITPSAVTDGVEIRYEVEPMHAHPEKHSLFWKYARPIFGVDLNEGVGLKGKGLSGIMDFRDYFFSAEFIPVLPYREDGTYCPYPVFTVSAVDKNTGKTLISTKAVAPASTEMGCRNCHGGDYRWKGVSGLSDETSINILKVHDRKMGTTLLRDAERGRPRLCQSCHADPAVGAQGKKGILNFSAAIHGFHANYMSGLNSEACNLCHPSGHAGNTDCLRDRHASLKSAGITCVNCHGRIEDHALSLLAGQSGIRRAGILMANLETTAVKDKKEIRSRTPWINEPQCSGCHSGYRIEKGSPLSAFNSWSEGFDNLYRNSMDDRGVMCSACHSSTHAIYGARNIYEKHRDNIQPLQYQKLAGTIGTRGNCAVCHTVAMKDSAHHENIIGRKKQAAIVK